MNDKTPRLILLLGLLFILGTVLIRNRTVKFELELESAPKDRKKDQDDDEEQVPAEAGRESED